MRREDRVVQKCIDRCHRFLSRHPVQSIDAGACPRASLGQSAAGVRQLTARALALARRGELRPRHDHRATLQLHQVTPTIAHLTNDALAEAGDVHMVTGAKATRGRHVNIVAILATRQHLRVAILATNCSISWKCAPNLDYPRRPRHFRCNTSTAKRKSDLSAEARSAKAEGELDSPERR